MPLAKTGTFPQNLALKVCNSVPVSVVKLEHSASAKNPSRYIVVVVVAAVVAAFVIVVVVVVVIVAVVGAPFLRRR